MELPKKRNRCDRCGKSVKWAQGADNQYFLVDLPEQTRHVCPPNALKFVRAPRPLPIAEAA